jgi:hypothetical protein
MIAYCGLVCSECEAFLATQANDLVALERLAARARDEYGMAGATLESTMCDGCLSSSHRLCGYCHECQVRACAMERAVPNCAHCPDFACDTLVAFWEMAGEARSTLDAIRAGLGT